MVGPSHGATRWVSRPAPSLDGAQMQLVNVPLEMSLGGGRDLHPGQAPSTGLAAPAPGTVTLREAG